MARAYWLITPPPLGRVVSVSEMAQRGSGGLPRPVNVMCPTSTTVESGKVGVEVLVAVLVAVSVGVLVAVSVGALVGVSVGTFVEVGVSVGTFVGVSVGTSVGVSVAVGVSIGVSNGAISDRLLFAPEGDNKAAAAA